MSEHTEDKEDKKSNKTEEEQEDNGKKFLTTIRNSWGEAITILVGAIVFVTAFAWRDLFQLIIGKIKQRWPSSFSPIIVSFTLAVVLTIGSIVLILTTGYRKKQQPTK